MVIFKIAKKEFFFYTMKNLGEILESVLLVESVSVEAVNNAIDKKYRVIINYHSKGEDTATGARVIEVYAYGLTKAGNPVIRAFQPYGDTTSRVPNWKFFRLDRISDWKPTNQRFTAPASDYYPALGEFNPNGDKSMSVVYNIARFDGYKTPDVSDIAPNTTGSGPKGKQPETPQQQAKASQATAQSNLNQVYKTDTEKNMERLRQQINDPIYLSDLKTKNSFDALDNKFSNSPNMNGPKPTPSNEPTVQNIGQADNNQPNLTNEPSDDNLYKTDTERGMENLRNQLRNPRMVDQSVLDRYNKEKERRNRRNNSQNQ